MPTGFGLVQCESKLEEEITWITRLEALEDAIGPVTGCNVD